MKKNEKSNKKGIIIGVSTLALVLLCGGGYTVYNKVNDNKTVLNNTEQTSALDEDITIQDDETLSNESKENEQSITNDQTNIEETSAQADTEISKEEQYKKENNSDKLTELITNQEQTQAITTKKQEPTTKQVATEKQTETTTQATTKAPVKETTQTTTKKPAETTKKEPTTEATTKAPASNGDGSTPNYDEMTDDEFWDSVEIIDSVPGADVGGAHNADFDLTGNQIGH